LGSAPLRREKSRRTAPGSAKADVPAPDPQTPAGSPRKGRLHPETTSGEGNFTAARVTSRYRGIRVSAFSRKRRAAGAQTIRGRARGSHLDCRAGKHRSGLRAQGLAVAAPRASRAMQAERSFERVSRASEEFGRAGGGNGAGLARRFGSWKTQPLTRRRRKRLWCSLAQGFNHRREGATGSVRGKAGDLPPAEQAAGLKRKRRSGGPFDRGPHRTEWALRRGTGVIASHAEARGSTSSELRPVRSRAGIRRSAGCS